MLNERTEDHDREPPDLVMPLATYAWIILRARQLDAADELPPTDDEAPPEAAELLTDRDNTREELRTTLDDLDDDQRAEALAVLWLGRGDFGPGDWKAALSDATAARDKRETDYLIGTPGLGDLLAEGLAQLGVAEEDLEA